jgi:hypothetical protein
MTPKESFVQLVRAITYNHKQTLKLSTFIKVDEKNEKVTGYRQNTFFSFYFHFSGSWFNP